MTMDMDQIKQLLIEAKAEMSKGNWGTTSKVLAKAKTLLERSVLDTKAKETLTEVLVLKATADGRRGQYRHGIADAQKAVDIARSLKSPEWEAEALRALGHIHWVKSDIPGAEKFLDEALIKAKDSQVKALIGKIKIDLGNICAVQGQFPQSRLCFLEALRILKNTEALHELARCHNNLGYTLLNMKQYKDALPAFKQAMEVSDKAGNARIRTVALLGLAEGHIYLGNLDMAEELLSTALKPLIEFDDKAAIASAYRTYGLLYTSKKDWPKAEANFRKALGIMKVTDQKDTVGTILKALGVMYMAKGDKASATTKLTEAREVFKEIGISYEVVNVERLLEQNCS
jgi:tetratricopeptide (TPR) repeat protein